MVIFLARKAQIFMILKYTVLPHCMLRDHSHKNNETRETAYTCRYNSGYLIPNSVYTHD